MDEIRKKHALLECDMEIRFQKSILNSGASNADKEMARKRIEEVEAMKKKIENMK